MPKIEFKIKTPDGLRLYGQGWEPEAKTQGAICLLHGLGEHGGRYDPVAEAFAKAGFSLLSIDLRGHGRSEGRRGHAPNHEVLMSDISQLLETARQRYPDAPVFFYGHSLGGNLVLHYALRNRPELAGIVATAPLLRLAYDPPRWKIWLLRILRALQINVAIPSGLDDTALSRDINVTRSYRNDPLTHDRITARMAVDMVRHGKWCLEHAGGLHCPLLLMHGGSDRITSVEASREFAGRAGANCTLKIWEGFYHELHNEPGKHEVLAYMLDWLENCLSVAHE